MQSSMQQAAMCIRYVKRFLLAGVMEEAEFKESDIGTPQGGRISPVLANVYLHYVLDLWYEKYLKKMLKGEVYYVRYAGSLTRRQEVANIAWVCARVRRK